MAKYCVTGAAGFIGARVVEMLLDSGHQVVGIDNLNHAYDVRMKEHRLSQLQNRNGFVFYPLDICDRQALVQAFEGAPFEAVFNLAARAGVRQSVENPWVYTDTNVTGTLNLLELCRQYPIPKFILASSSSVYGADAPLPTPEDADSNRPLSIYAASKKAAEALSYSYHHLYNIDISIFRYFVVYGPRGRPDMSMFRFVQWITEGRPLRLYGDGEQVRGFTYVDDIARGTILGLKPLGYEIINLGGHEAVRINALIRLMEELIGKKAQIEQLPAHPADVFANHANVEKAGRLLGWEPSVSLRAGVERLVAWYNAERSWASRLQTD
jgi:UDP-glucuronate 4-epimerase